MPLCFRTLADLAVGRDGDGRRIIGIQLNRTAVTHDRVSALGRQLAFRVHVKFAVARVRKLLIGQLYLEKAGAIDCKIGADTRGIDFTLLEVESGPGGWHHETIAIHAELSGGEAGDDASERNILFACARN